MVSGGWVRGGWVSGGWVRGDDGEATSRAADVVSVAVSELMMLFAVTVAAAVSAAAAAVAAAAAAAAAVADVRVAVSGLKMLFSCYCRSCCFGCCCCCGECCSFWTDCLLLLFERLKVLSIWRNYTTEGTAQLSVRPTKKPAQY